MDCRTRSSSEAPTASSTFGDAGPMIRVATVSIELRSSAYDADSSILRLRVAFDAPGGRCVMRRSARDLTSAVPTADVAGPPPSVDRARQESA